MFLALSVALVVGGMIPGHHARAQERPRYGGELVFDPGQKTPEDTGEGWQIAADRGGTRNLSATSSGGSGSRRCRTRSARGPRGVGRGDKPWTPR